MMFNDKNQRKALQEYSICQAESAQWSVSKSLELQYIRCFRKVGKNTPQHTKVLEFGYNHLILTSSTE